MSTMAKTVVIAGTSSGTGVASAKRFARERWTTSASRNGAYGAHTTLVARDPGNGLLE